jgi:CheY-like chemotaxis protein
MVGWCNGRHWGLRSPCLMACGFDSRPDHCPFAGPKKHRPGQARTISLAARQGRDNLSGSFFLALLEVTMLRLPSKLTMMIVEDDKMIGRMIKDYFSPMAYDFIVVDNAEDALDLALIQNPNVLITDIMMPGKDGIWLIKGLRTFLEFATMPIIAVTAAGPDTREAAMKAGAHMVLEKPIKREALLEAVSTLLRASPFVKRPTSDTGHP